MIIKLEEQHREQFLDFVNADPYANLFFIGDVLEFGFDSSKVSFYGEFIDGNIVSTVMVFTDVGLHLYATTITEEYLDFVRELYGRMPIKNIMIAKATQVLLENKLDDLIAEERPTTLSVYQPNDFTVETDDVMRLAVTDAERIQVLENLVFPDKTTEKEKALTLMQEQLESGTRLNYGYLINNQLVATAACVAMTPTSGMIVAVGTHPDFEKNGYATKVVKKLSDDLLTSGRHAVLFYDNPAAGRIYERMGYTPHCTYYMNKTKQAMAE